MASVCQMTPAVKVLRKPLSYPMVESKRCASTMKLIHLQLTLLRVELSSMNPTKVKYRKIRDEYLVQDISFFFQHAFEV